MGKIPVSKFLYSFLPAKCAAVNDLIRTITNGDFTERLILYGFDELLRMVANDIMVSPAGIEPATSP